MAGFLTDEWLADLAAAAAEVTVPPETHLVVQQVVADGDHEVAYALQVGGGALAVRRGRVAAPDITLHQDAETARAIHEGRLSAQTAFLDGRLRLSGDVAALLAAAPVLAELHDVFARVRAELPEIQAHVERLDAAFAGSTLDRFTPLAFTALKTADPPPEVAYGHQLVFVGRRGKHLLLDFGAVTFVVHLMQGGRLRVDEKQSAKPRAGQARWHFADGRALLLTEAGTERKAGVWVVAGDPEEQPPLKGLGPDADTIDKDALASLLAANPVRLHGFLRDQHLIAGLGRLLANEICHRAKLSPFATTTKLDSDDVAQLAEAIQVCINEGLAFERGLTEMSSSADRPSHVHHRVGEPCPECGDVVRTVEYSHYAVAYCATCQTNGKVLADNTTSKFLK